MNSNKNNVGINLWKVGSFWILLFIFIIGGIDVLANSKSFLFFLAEIISVEFLIVVLGAFILKSSNMISEKGFIKYMSMALKIQSNLFKIFKDKDN